MLVAITTTGIGILAASTAGLVTAIGGVVIGLRNHTTIIEVRQLANGQNVALKKRTAQLEQALQNAGIPIPPDPSVSS